MELIHGNDSSRFGCRADSNIVGNFVKKIIVYFLFSRSVSLFVVHYLLLQVMIIGIYCRTYLLRHNLCATSHYSIYNAYLDEKVKVLAIMNFLVLQNLTNIECSSRLESSYPLFPS